jgi:hypothetical protein
MGECIEVTPKIGIAIVENAVKKMDNPHITTNSNTCKIACFQAEECNAF